MRHFAVYYARQIGPREGLRELFQSYPPTVMTGGNKRRNILGLVHLPCPSEVHWLRNPMGFSLSSVAIAQRNLGAEFRWPTSVGLILKLGIHRKLQESVQPPPRPQHNCMRAPTLFFLFTSLLTYPNILFGHSLSIPFVHINRLYES